MVSAQRSSALFPLPKFRSVADLKVKCLAWLVSHEFMFDKKQVLGKCLRMGFLLFFMLEFFFNL